MVVPIDAELRSFDVHDTMPGAHLVHFLEAVGHPLNDCRGQTCSFRFEVAALAAGVQVEVLGLV